jgi:hypothetical protein
MSDKKPLLPIFSVSGNATIKHLNVRKEGPEDEKVLAVDVKLEISKVDRRICACFDEALEAFLWRGDTDALIVRNYMLSPVKYGHTLRSVRVVVGSETFSDCEVGKFTFEPARGGVFTLGLSVTITEIGSDEVAGLARMVQDKVYTSIEAAPDLFTQAGNP